MLHKPTEPSVAPAWLAIHEYPDGGRSITAIAERPGAVDFHKLLSELPKWSGEPRLVISRDSPELKASCDSGFWIHNSATLAARDMWFQRFWSILEPAVSDPRISNIYTFSPATVPASPFASYQSSARGPYYFPERLDAPVCAYCNNAVMGFVCCLSTQNYSRCRLPGDAIILHACPKCGICFEGVAITWLLPGDTFRLIGDDLGAQSVKIGARWQVTEYLCAAMRPDQLSDDPVFNEEGSIWMNFACHADKVDGHALWMQGDYTPTDANGKPMQFVAQFAGSDDVAVGGSGLVYVFYSPDTKETKTEVQYT